jgi:exodeoxyribonuclease VII large subunit
MRLKSSSAELNNIERNIGNMSPANVLKRGYSITLLNGKSITSVSQIQGGDVINTTVSEGEIVSIVSSTIKPTDQ